MKYTSLDYVNNLLKQAKRGVLIDTTNASYLVQHLVYDCKNERIKAEYSFLYNNEDELISKLKNNTWWYANRGEIDPSDLKGYNNLCEVLNRKR